MRHSEITLVDAITMLDAFAPVKITFNDIVLYNDYDNEPEPATSLYGEQKPPIEVLFERLWQAKHYIVTDISIAVVEYHHSIIKLKGRYEPHIN